MFTSFLSKLHTSKCFKVPVPKYSVKGCVNFHVSLRCNHKINNPAEKTGILILCKYGPTEGNSKYSVSWFAPYPSQDGSRRWNCLSRCKLSRRVSFICQLFSTSLQKNFLHRSCCNEGPKLVDASGHNIPDLLEAILKLFPLDTYVFNPVILMDLVNSDKKKNLQVRSLQWQGSCHYTIKNEHD